MFQIWSFRQANVTQHFLSNVSFRRDFSHRSHKSQGDYDRHDFVHDDDVYSKSGLVATIEFLFLRSLLFEV